MKPFFAITFLLAFIISFTCFATEPPKAHRCIVSKCVSKYYMCHPSSDKNCKPRLTLDQKQVLSAYRLCKSIGKKSCQHPGINDRMLKRLANIKKQFNACKLACYQQFAPKLHSKVFNH